MSHFNQFSRRFDTRLKRKRQPAVGGLCAIALLVQVTAFPAMTKAQGMTGSIKGTVSATTNDPSARPAALAGALVSLVNADLKGTPVKTQTDETGNFAFLELPSGNYTLTAAAGG